MGLAGSGDTETFGYPEFEAASRRHNFGALGDRYGRARMLTVTVLIYSIFTGLTFFSRTYWDFALCRFLTGLGVGGVFGLAVSLIAETLPDASRRAARSSPSPRAG